MGMSIGRRGRKLVRLARNVLMDLRFGGFAGGYVENRHPGATTVGNTDYALMPQIFGGRIRGDDVLVEVGCGKGRVINWWLSQGFRNRIVGLEIMEDVAERTRARLRRFPNVEIVTGDVLTCLPHDGTLFYLFNPFNSAVMGQFKLAMRDICRTRPGIRILYFACVHLATFSDDSEWYVEECPITASGVGKFEDRHSRMAVIQFRAIGPEPQDP